jgi:predicted helicase
MYNFNRYDAFRNVMSITENYNEHVAKLRNTPRGQAIDDFVLNDETKINWSEGLKHYLVRYIPIEFKETQFRIALYRPFTKQYLYFDKYLNERRYQIPWFSLLKIQRWKIVSFALLIGAQRSLLWL